MKKTGIKSKVASVAITGCMAITMGMPALAFATPTENGHGLQDGNQTYDSVQIADENGVNPGEPGYIDTVQGWDPAENDGTGGAGQIQIVYSTEGGQWIEPSDPIGNGDSTPVTDPDGTPDSGDETYPDPGSAHDNGTFMVVLPKLIQYENMTAGTVSVEDDYTVAVRGFIDGDKKVVLTADASSALVTEEGAGGVTATTTQGKTEWSADECFGGLHKNGSLKGTTATDNIALTGVAKTAGAYKGTIQYTAELANA